MDRIFPRTEEEGTAADWVEADLVEETDSAVVETVLLAAPVVVKCSEAAVVSEEISPVPEGGKAQKEGGISEY